MQSPQEQLRDRTKKFAIEIIRLSRVLPPTPDAEVLKRQVLRSGTAVAANYRAAGRARSKAEFVAKLGIVVEEADETVFWLEMMRDSGVLNGHYVDPLLREVNELLAIFAA